MVNFRIKNFWLDIFTGWTNFESFLYIVSYYFTQEINQNNKMNSFVICRPKTENENKKIINYPFISFKFDEPNIKYTKFEYR